MKQTAFLWAAVVSVSPPRYCPTAEPTVVLLVVLCLVLRSRTLRSDGELLRFHGGSSPHCNNTIVSLRLGFVCFALLVTFHLIQQSTQMNHPPAAFLWASVSLVSITLPSQRPPTCFCCCCFRCVCCLVVGFPDRKVQTLSPTKMSTREPACSAAHLQCVCVRKYFF